MALKDIVIQTDEVVYGKSSFVVHGLTIEILMALMAQGHRAEMEQAVDTLRKAVGDDLENVDSKADVVGALATIVVDLPVLAAKVIAMSAGEPDEWEKVRLLSAPVLLDAATKIGKLTFDGEDSVKKFITNIIELMVSMRKNATPAVQAVREALAGTKG